MALDSLRAYAPHYRHWAIAYSGGKDSSTLATLIPWAILTGRLPRPESLTILYADTRQELPPLQMTAMRLICCNEGTDGEDSDLCDDCWAEKHEAQP